MTEQIIFCKPGAATERINCRSSTSYRNNCRTDTSASLLPKNFTPGKNDVIIGRGKKCHGHFGNKILTYIISSRLEEYSGLILQYEKSQILRSIVNQIRNNGINSGGFVKQDPKTKQWFDVGDNLAREKMSKAFRDALIKRRRHPTSNNCSINNDCMSHVSESPIFYINDLSQTLESNHQGNHHFSRSFTLVSESSESSEESLGRIQDMDEEYDIGNHHYADFKPKAITKTITNTERMNHTSSVLEEIDTQGLDCNGLGNTLDEDFSSSKYSPFEIQIEEPTVTPKEISFYSLGDWNYLRDL